VRTLLAGLIVALAVLAPSGAVSADTRPLRATITFDKNWRDPHRSSLTWAVRRGTEVVERRTWRAGSGFTRRSTDACRRNDGWLPDGSYRPRLYADYWGSLIKGRAIGLGQKPCANGTMRTDLFIHTEQGARSRQCPDTRGDQACRWEYPRIDDYRSYGCIKLSPADLRELWRAWRRHFRLGYDARVSVVVKA
jgi:hypothetical protein